MIQQNIFCRNQKKNQNKRKKKKENTPPERWIKHRVVTTGPISSSSRLSTTWGGRTGDWSGKGPVWIDGMVEIGRRTFQDNHTPETMTGPFKKAFSYPLLEDLGCATQIRHGLA